MAREVNNWTLYVLKLEQGKWYVDVTASDPQTQLKRHQAGRGAQWTQRFKPVDVSYAKEFGTISEEDALKYAGRFLRKYMEHYGDANVRGGGLPDESPVADSTKSTAKQKNEVKRFRIWNPITQIIVITILVAIIAYLLVDKLYLTPSTAMTITQ